MTIQCFYLQFCFAFENGDLFRVLLVQENPHAPRPFQLDVEILFPLRFHALDDHLGSSLVEEVAVRVQFQNGIDI